MNRLVEFVGLGRQVEPQVEQQVCDVLSHLAVSSQTQQEQFCSRLCRCSHGSDSLKVFFLRKPLTEESTHSKEEPQRWTGEILEVHPQHTEQKSCLFPQRLFLVSASSSLLRWQPCGCGSFCCLCCSWSTTLSPIDRFQVNHTSS